MHRNGSSYDTLGSFWGHFGIVLVFFGISLGSFWGHCGVKTQPKISQKSTKNQPKIHQKSTNALVTSGPLNCFVWHIKKSANRRVRNFACAKITHKNISSWTSAPGQRALALGPHDFGCFRYFYRAIRRVRCQI